jgi:hypothetical protein
VKKGGIRVRVKKTKKITLSKKKFKTFWRGGLPCPPPLYPPLHMALNQIFHNMWGKKKKKNIKIDYFITLSIRSSNKPTNKQYKLRNDMIVD